MGGKSKKPAVSTRTEVSTEPFNPKLVGDIIFNFLALDHGL